MPDRYGSSYGAKAFRDWVDDIESEYYANGGKCATYITNSILSNRFNLINIDSVQDLKQLCTSIVIIMLYPKIIPMFLVLTAVFHPKLLNPYPYIPICGRNDERFHPLQLTP